MSKKQATEVTSFNAINWFELPTNNMARAIDFYQAVLGVTLTQEFFGGFAHAVFPSKCPQGATSAAGALVAGAPHLAPGSLGTVVYLNCPDGVPAALARAAVAGATTIVPHTAIGPNGFFAIIDDLDGNRVGLHAGPASEIVA